MAQLAFSKLGLKINKDIKELNWDEQVVEVKQYLPIEEKLDLIAKVVEASADESNFSNPVKNDMYFTIYMIDKYTNLKFTDKQREDLIKLYDQLVSSGFAAAVETAVVTGDVDTLRQDCGKVIKSIYKYKNSVLGLLETISTDYNNMELDIMKLKDALGENVDLSFLKDVMTKMG